MRRWIAIISLCFGAGTSSLCAGEHQAELLHPIGKPSTDPLGLRLVRLCREQVLRPMGQHIRQEVQRHYSPRHLEGLMASGDAETRRAATFGIGLIGDAQSASVIASAMHDPDAEVCHRAEAASWLVWERMGSVDDQVRIVRIKHSIKSQDLQDAISQASLLVQVSPDYAEAWNQRALAYYQLRRYRDAIPDCLRALELNPYHFGASSGLAQCHLRLDELPQALDALEVTAKLHPSMPGLQEQIVVLSSMMKK